MQWQVSCGSSGFDHLWTGRLIVRQLAVRLVQGEIGQGRRVDRLDAGH